MLIALMGLAIAWDSWNKATLRDKIYNFPETGYISQDPYVDVSGTVTVLTDDSGKPTTIQITIKIDHRNEAETLRNVIVSAKVSDSLTGILFTRDPYVVTGSNVRMTLGSGGYPGLTFGATTPIDPDSASLSTQQVTQLCDAPILVKLSHADGIELIEIRPIVSVQKR